MFVGPYSSRLYMYAGMSPVTVEEVFLAIKPKLNEFFLFK